MSAKASLRVCDSHPRGGFSSFIHFFRLSEEGFWGVSRFLVGQKATGKVLVIVSFLAGCQPRERLRFIDARSPTAQTHILAWPNKIPGFSMTVLSTITGESVLVDCICWFNMTSAKLSIICVDEEKKESVEIRKRLLWEMKLIDWSKYSWCSAKESSVLSKRIVGAQQKNRRCSAKESTMLKGSSQYTLRYHLTAMPWEVVVWE